MLIKRLGLWAGIPVEPWSRVYARNQKKFTLHLVSGIGSLQRTSSRRGIIPYLRVPECLSLHPNWLSPIPSTPQQKGAQHSLAGERAGGANWDQKRFIHISQTLMCPKITEFEPLLTGERKTYVNLY